MGKTGLYRKGDIKGQSNGEWLAVSVWKKGLTISVRK